MAITNTLTLPNTLTGRLVKIAVDRSAAFSGNQPTRWLIWLKVDQAGSTRSTTYKISMNRSLLERQYQALGLDSLNAKRLLEGTDLEPEILDLINESQIILTATLDAASIRKLAAKQNALLTATSVVVSSSDPLEPDEVYYQTNTGNPAMWPGRDPVLPFTPVPVPVDSVSNGSPTVRIGYAVFDNPIHYVEQMRTTNLNQIPSIRQTGTLKKGTGQAYETFTISYIANGPREIKTSVQEVFEQLALTPFTTAEGGPFGARGEIGDIPYHALAVRNFSISTLDGLPGAVQVDISFDPFNWEFHCPVSNGVYPRYDMDDMICWPLVKVWAKTRERSRYDGKKFSGRLSLSFPTEDAARQLEALFSIGSVPSIAEDANAVQTLAARIAKDNNGITSKKMKEILHPAGPQTGIRYYVLKVSDEKTYRNFVPYDRRVIEDDEVGRGGEYFVGFVDWKKLDASNQADEFGNFLPSSASVNVDEITTVFGQGLPLMEDRRQSDAFVDSLAIADIKRPGRGNASLDDQIELWVANRMGFATIPASGDPTRADYVRRVLPEVKNVQTQPWRYFGILLRTNRQNEKQLRDYAKRISEMSRREDSHKYDGMGNRLRRIFSQTEAMTTVLHVGPGGGDSEIVVERISGSRGHNLALTSARADPLPLHSYMGGMDSTFVVEGKCFGLDAKQKLEALKQEFDRRAIFKTSREFDLSSDVKRSEAAGSAFLRVENEIFQLLGVDFVVPMTINFQSLDSQPGVWAFTITFLEYDPKQKTSEEIKFLPTTFDSMGKVFNYGWNSSGRNPIHDKGIEYLNLQSSLSEIESYPDMSLPTRGELKFWIGAITAGAKRWNPKNPDGLRRLNKGIMPEQKAIIEMISDQFYPSYANRIANTWELNQNLNAKALPGSYVDPDFYCWYDPDHSFGSIFDDLAEHLMGPGPQSNEKGSPKNKEGYTLAAPGRDDSVTDPNQLPVAPYREYDPTFGTTTVYSHKYWAANPERVKVERELIDAYNTHTYPENRANRARTAMDNVKKEMDGTQGAWWPTFLDYNISFLSPDKKILRLSVEQEKAALNGWINDKFLNPEEDSVDSIDRTKYFTTYTDANRYFELKWRQEQTIKAASSLKPSVMLPNRIKDSFLRNPYFLFNNPQVLYDNPNGINLREIEEAIRQHIDSYSIDFRDYKKKYKEPDWEPTTEFDVPPIQSGPYLPQGLIISQGPSYLAKTAMLSAGLMSATTVPNGFVFGQDAVSSMIENWNFVDSIGHRYKIDPHVIRAFFMRRDGFGQFDPLGSVEDGFGDLDPEATRSDRNNDPATARNNVDIFSKLYNRNLQRLKRVPTLALIATQMMLTTTARRDYYDNEKKDIKAEILTDLKNMADSINLSRYSQGTARILSQAIKKYWSAANVVDQYYAGYISLCRTFGSYWNESIMGREFDAFFFPLNPLIMMDVPENEASIVTRFSPSGDEVTISLSRTSVDVIDPNLKDAEFDINRSSLEIAAEQAKKHRAAMDPQSEGAIYGSLVDMREHSSFGKLRGAYPTYQILLINEGFYWASGSKKLWDQFYTRTGVASIEIHRTRHMPGGTASVVFSNMFHNLTAYAQMEALQHQLAIQQDEKIKEFITSPSKFWGAIGDIWNDLVIKNVPDDVKKIWQNNHLKRLALTAGTRMQIRMGYGSNAANLPVVFNGTVIECPVTEGYVTLTAVSDGYELEKPSTTKLVKSGNAFAFQDGGIAGTGKDPSSIVTESLVGATVWDAIFQGNFRDFSIGIAHFGETYFEGTRWYPAEVQINLYSSKTSKLEQGISSLQNYNIINAVTNWDNDKNLFSVEVQEPTPWKVMEVCRRACQDYVASAEWFANRSTVFFGKWWWPYHYTYHPKIGDLGKLSEAFTGAGFINDIVDQKRAQTVLARTGANTDGSKDTSSMTVKPEVNLLSRLYSGERPDLAKLAYDTALEHKPYGIIRSIKLVKKTTRQEIVDHVRDVERQYEETNPPQSAQESRERERRRRSEDRVPQADMYTFAIIWGDGTQTQYTISDRKRDQYIRNDNGTYIKVPQGVSISSADNSKNYGAGPAISTDFLKDVENLVTYLRWKPYMQAYIAHSGINLLDNNIRADGSKVYTDAIGLHLYNGWISADSVTKTITYSVDTDIHPGDRRTMMVDTGILLTGLQAGTDAVAGGIATAASYIPLVGGFIDEGRKYIEESPSTPAIENAVISALVDTVKDMYQGWFTITGQPTMKPRDLVHLTDHITELKGPVFVKEVVHRMDAQMGFVTLVSPDACAFPHSSIVGQQLVVSLCTGILGRIASLMIFKMAATGTWALLTGKINKNISLKAGDSYSRYKRLQKLNGKVDQKVSAEVFNKVNNAITDQLIENTKPGTLKNFEKWGAIDEEFQSRFNGSNDYQAMLNFAKENNLAVDVQDLPSVKENITLQQAIFEESLLKEKAEMLEDVRGSKTLSGLNTDEAEEAVEKYINDKRSAWYDANQSEVDKLLKITGTDVDIEALQKRANDLISRKEAGLIKRSLGNGPTPEEIKEINKELGKIIEDLQDAVNDGRIPFRDLDREIRKLVSSPTTKWVDSVFVDAIKKSFRAGIDTPVTLIRGFGKTTGALSEAIGDSTRAGFRSFAGRKATAFIPSGKENVLIKSWNFYKNVKKIDNSVEKGKVVVDAARTIAKLRITEGLKAVRALTTGVRILKYMGPQAIISLAVDTSIAIIAGSLIQGHNARLRARQCVRIIPLMARGSIPYTAGIKGHQGAVIGDSPSWADELISGLHGSSKALPEWLSTSFLYFNALNGIELPEYGRTEVDQKWLEKLKQEELAQSSGQGR